MVAPDGCPLGAAAPLPVGYGSALVCRIRRIDKLVCRKARCRRPTLCRVCRMRKRRMRFGGKRKTPYSLPALIYAKPHSCAFFESDLDRRSCLQRRWHGVLARDGAGTAILPAAALFAITGAFPNRLAAQALAKLDLPTVVVFAPRPDARSEKPRDSCADPFEFRPVAKRLVSHGDDRDSQAEQRISSCGIRSDALGCGVFGIAVVLNGELCLLPIEVAKEIASIERLLLCCVERDEAV